MTLIIGLQTRDQTVLLSDRRVTSDWQDDDDDDESNKAAVFSCKNARVAVAFTGLLQQKGGFKTSRCLSEALMELAPPDYLIEPTIVRLRERATRALQEVRVTNQADKRLSILLAGYTYDETPPRCYYWFVSNFEDGESLSRADPSEEFMIRSWSDARPSDQGFSSLFTGGTDVVPDQDIESLRALLREGKPPQALIGKTEEVMRAAADLPAPRGAIGKQITSIVLPREPTADTTGQYHSEKATSTVYFPSYITARGDEGGCYVIQDPSVEYVADSGPSSILAVPKVGRNEPCPCQSGKKYKHCHGK
jgi:SEC-C motif